jgi:Phage Mu protein F like protein
MSCVHISNISQHLKRPPKAAAMANTKPANPSPEVLRYFAEKKLKPSFSYKDVWGEEHGHAFTVAKSAGFDILQDVRDAVQAAIENGETFETFKTKLEPVLRSKGWWGTRKIIDPKTGEKVNAKLGTPRRLKIIYESNLRAARSAGQFERAMRTKGVLPYFQYRLGPSEVHRPLHQEKDGLILPVDDPFWDQWFPPNGWGCKCWLRTLTKAEAADSGGVSARPKIETKPFYNDRKRQTEQIPAGIDPGWQTSPGKARARFMTDRLSERLQDEGEANVKPVVAELWSNGTAMALANVVERIRIPVGVSEKVQKALDAKSSLIIVSSDTVQAKIAKHGRIAAESFALVQNALEQGDHTGITGLTSGYRVWMQIGGLMHRLVIKKSQTGYLYVSTFFESGLKAYARDKAKR